jgi:histidyl-tRNA synthetase
MIDLQPVKGTRDFYPPQLRLRNWLFNTWRKSAHQAGFEEYDACVLEHEALYIRKAGDEISQQLYNLEDNSARKLSLRPEMTPSLARMILRKQKSLSYPVRWFSIPQCFRYERMARGRKREHYQWNLDIIGEPSILAELEIISTLIRSLKELGLDLQDFRVFINDRRILNALLDQLQVPHEQQTAVLVVLDKRDKLPVDVLRLELSNQGLSDSQSTELIQFLELPDLEAVAEHLQNQNVLNELENILSQFQKMGLGDYLKFDISIVRGLSYYTGTVFEINTPTKTSRAISGGGRYDSLLSAFGGPPIPAVGFGFGDVVILEILEETKKLPELTQELDLVVFALDSRHNETAMHLAHQLRDVGLRVQIHFGQMKMQKALQQANSHGVSFVMLCFPNELARNEVVVRDLRNRRQKSYPLTKITDLSWMENA